MDYFSIIIYYAMRSKKIKTSNYFRLERKDMHLKNSMLRVNTLEEDIRKLGNDLDREQHSHTITKLKVAVSVIAFRHCLNTHKNNITTKDKLHI